MKLCEIADAEEQLALWKLISDAVWVSVSQQAEQQRARTAVAKTRSRRSPSPTRSVPYRFKAVPPSTAPTTPPIKVAAATRSKGQGSTTTPSVSQATSYATTATSLQPSASAVPTTKSAARQPRSASGTVQSVRKPLKSSA